MRTRRPALVAVTTLAGLLALGLVACDDDTSSDDEETIDEAADEEVIEAALLTIDDVPEGFEETDYEEQDESDNAAEEECQRAAGANPEALEDNEVVDGEGAEFQREVAGESLLGITVGITSFADRDLAGESLEILSDDDYLGCAAASISEEAAADGQELGDVSVEAIDPVFDGDAGGSIRIEFETQGFPTVIEEHLVLVDRFGISLQVVSVNEEIDEDLVEELLTTMVDRIEGAVAE